MQDAADHPEEPESAGTPPHAGSLSPAEELSSAIVSGRPVRRGGGEPAAEGDNWEEDRQLPADLLYELLVRPAGAAKPRAAILVGLRITGHLNLESADLQAPLIAHNCHFDAPVNLIAAEAPEISLTACHLPGLAADRLETRGTLDLSKSTLGLIGLLGAHIGGQLILSGTALASGTYPPDLGDGTLRPPESPAETFEGLSLVADSLEVDHGMECREGFTAEGEVRLLDAHIGGQLSFIGATLGGRLHADSLRVDGSMFCREGFSAEGDVRLLGAHVGGQLSFEGATLGAGLHADGLRVERDMFCKEGFSAEGDVRLLGAHVGGLEFIGARLGQGLNADSLRVDGYMFCSQGFTAAGEVWLLGAHVGGQLSFAGATLGQGFVADGLRVDRDLLCSRGFAAAGEIRLPGAHVGGQLEFDGATLGQGLHADGLRVNHNMLCRDGFTAVGEVRLLGAQIGRQLAFSGASLAQGLNADTLRVDESMFCNDGFTAGGEVRLLGAHVGHLSFDGAMLGQGLNAQTMQVDEDMFCSKGFTAAGEVGLLGVQIGGRLSFDGAALTNAGIALDLNGARVDGGVALRFAMRPAGGVDLSGARLGDLYDSESTWPMRLWLRGCAYASLQATEDAPHQPQAGHTEGAARRATWLRRRSSRGGRADVQRRLRWIRRAEDGDLESTSWPRRARRRRLQRRYPDDSRRAASPAGAGYAPSPYTQLMAFYRREGRDGDARRVAYERERRRKGVLGFPGRTWNAFLQWTVGYGYKPLRALVLLIALVLVGSLVFSSFHTDGHLTAAKDEHPPFVASIYTLDRLIPVVSLGLRDAFAPSGAAQWWAFAYTLLGWILTVAVAAGVNAAVRRD